ncbi:kelch repeat-containing protein [Nannocystis pusilla]|uniref:kelch repeat-containing protein n=1 Tax=Nannocystis pusilla TaxID=889268 RepID=UPI003B800730
MGVTTGPGRRRGGRARSCLEAECPRAGGERDDAGLAQRDPTTGAWAPRASLPWPRVAYDAVVLRGGDVLVVGGGEANLYDRSTSETWRYDPGSDTWDTAAPLPVARLGQATARLADGRVLVAGGVDATGAPSRASTSMIRPPTAGAGPPISPSVAVGPSPSRSDAGVVVHGGDGRDAAGEAFVVLSLSVGIHAVIAGAPARSSRATSTSRWRSP